MIIVNVKATGALTLLEKPEELVSFAGMNTQAAAAVSAGRVGSSHEDPMAAASTYVFSFSVDVAKALPSGVQSARVTAYQLKDAIQFSNKKPDVIDAILAAAPSTFTENVFVIATVNVDLTAGASNDVGKSSTQEFDIDKLKKKKNIIVPMKVSDADKSGIPRPIIEISTIDGTNFMHSKRSLRESALEMINVGVDPSQAIDYDHVIGSRSSLNGTVSDIAAISSAPSILMRERYFMLVNDFIADSTSTDSFTGDVSVPIVQSVTTTQHVYSAKLKMNNEFIGEKFVVSVELVTADGIIVDKMLHVVNHADNVRLFNVPVVAPHVDVLSRPTIPGGMGYVSMKIKQLDKKGISVVVYKKTVSRIEHDVGTYTKVGEYAAKFGDGHVLVPILIDTTNPVVFRCIAVGAGGVLGSTYTNIVVRPSALRNLTVSNNYMNVSLVPKITRHGVVIEVRGIPHDAVSIVVQRKNATLRHGDDEFVDVGEILLVSENSMTPIEYVDDAQSLKNEHTYEYRCIVYTRYGSRHESGLRAHVEYVPLVVGVASTTISNAAITSTSSGDSDYTFDITTTIIESGMQAVKSLIDAQNIMEFYKDDVKDERELLEKIIAHKIVRFNLTTGETEDFGVFIGQTFSDFRRRDEMGVKPLAPGNSYRYEVYPLLRAPETMFTKLLVEKTSNGKKYKYAPDKYLHPLAIFHGNITTPESRAMNHAKDELSFGRIGTVVSTSVSILDEQPGVLDVSIEQSNPDMIVIRWKSQASDRKYDHFVVSRETPMAKSLLAAVHPITGNGTHDFVYELHDGDVGTMRFSVMPVFSDYSVGNKITSHDMVVMNK